MSSVDSLDGLPWSFTGAGVDARRLAGLRWTVSTVHILSVPSGLVSGPG